VFKSIFGHLKQGLAKTRERLASGLRALLSAHRKVDADFLEELEALLIQSDLGVHTATAIIEDLKGAYRDGAIRDSNEILDHIKRDLKASLAPPGELIDYADTPPTVIIVVGVNGSGKTTSIAKLAHNFTSDGKSVLLAASDTFRAAAVEQLSIWSSRVGADIVKHKMGSDPAAVAYDACEAALARSTDVLIVDTAGRLHTQENLMRELNKIKRVVEKKVPGAPHEVLMVLDATTGQNAISQAKLFREAVDITGIFLAKLDGTAKGGIVVAIRNQIDIPVKFVGIGEKPEDIEPFDPEEFVDALFD